MKFTFAIGIGTLLFGLPLVAQEKTSAAASATTVVVATGVGVDADKSLRNAFRNAVEQAVGLIVDAETVVKNEDVIKDQILTYSDGFVEKFDRVKEGKRDDGLYEVKIKAVVKRRQLIEKLKEEKISVAKIEGESLFAEVVTKLDAEKNAAKLLEKALDGLPVNILTATVADPKPRIVQKNDAGVKAMWTVVVGFDYKAYQENVLPKLREILDATAKRKSNSEITERAKASGADFSNARLTPVKRLPLWDEGQYIMGGAGQVQFDDQSELLVMLNVGRSTTADTRRWKWYVVDRDSTAPVFNAALARRQAVKITFIGAEDKVVRNEEIPLTDILENSSYYNPGGNDAPLWFLHVSHKGEYKTVEISPFVRTIVENGGFYFLYGNAIEASYQAEFSLDEIKEIREIRCSVVEMQPRRR
ncbi:MAG: hypothetical protein FJ403_23330 [Verrucomicrobia bacterium]|nr:hypothetical protein [Verrucomicrobiota bacterium]